MSAWIWWILYRLLYGVAATALALAVAIPGLLEPQRAEWWRSRLFPKPLGFQPELWIHAVSLGEARIAWALLARLTPEKRRRLLATATTSAGFDFFRTKLDPEQVALLPLDLEICLNRLWKGLRPAPLLIVETEIWPSLLQFQTRRGAATAILNGRLGPKSMRWAGNPLLRRLLGSLDAIGARGSLDAERFRACGAQESALRITGNMKYDYKPPAPPSGNLGQWLALPGELLVFASISTDEAELLAPMALSLLKQFPSMRILWAPRHLPELQTHLQALALALPVRRSQLETGQTPRLLLLDTFGELAGSYSSAKAALIGGSFNRRGGQNFLESLQAGTPVVLGPHTENFRQEVEDALAAGALCQVPDPEAAGQVLGRLLADEHYRKELAQRAAAAILPHLGAIDRSLSLLLDSHFLTSIDLEAP